MNKLNYEYHSFEELVTIADNKHNIKHLADLATATNILKDHPYYTLVNGYQRALEETDHPEQFREGISLELLAKFHTYESILSSNTLGILLAFETKFKNIVQDTVSQHFGFSENDYLNIGKYRNDTRISREKEIKHFRSISQSRHHVNHSTKKYRKNGNVPPWILVNELTFGEVKKWYLLLPTTLKEQVIAEFNYFNMPTDQFLEFFKISLDILNDFRNGLAHGDVLNKIIVKKSVHYFHLEYAFSEKVISNQEFNMQCIAKNDFFGSILLLFMLAPSVYRNILYVDLKSTLSLFNNELDLSSSQSRRLLGIPDRIIERLDTINQEILKIQLDN